MKNTKFGWEIVQSIAVVSARLENSVQLSLAYSAYDKYVIAEAQ